MYEFSVIGGKTAREIIGASRPQIVDVVRDTYLAHHAGDSVNPDSYFLRFPEKPDARIIALPAHLGGTEGSTEVSGIKWISSFPANIERGIPRASAALLLNDYETGYPFACLEASQISAARTAASAVLAAEQLTGGRTAGKLTVVGAGIIARNILEFFKSRDWTVSSVTVHDKSEEYGAALASYASESLGYQASTESSLPSALKDADVVVLATTAAEPYIVDLESFVPGQVVLNISLRDIGPELIDGAYNILDDVDHCLKANTSPHLAEQKYGSRDFITGTLAQVVKGEVTVGTDKPVIFSPFGLGVLDLAVGLHIYREAQESGRAVEIEDFFGETTRW
ncbi:2,3-diaminopropionate biosynthesis protein SbnB [Streptomyces sp. NBC_01142]|uniref:2,3-diaminopropionate biosynthesis protein SbnB n=1 Tax=Streptomyces sp. NBC_01142 TaxID=2975865 RepID=UPI002256B811|nr:2,3-diaminopropionate biosynthesis protein SbnB [Streptomyces sp. NBC_01142]MCX4819017.1 2,3-diaminopropionate biosynthesis protein SbnB [Streptomyces sp. NBC_01142]